MESDLKSKSQLNKMLKLADDTDLLVPEFTDVDLKDDFDAILAWVTANKMHGPQHEQNKGACVS